MENQNVFPTWKSKMDSMIDAHPLQIVTWEATRRCNLHCKHCGSPSEEVKSGNELTAEEIIGAFRETERDFDMSQFRHINITGGEPFVRTDLIHVLEQISQSQHYRNIDIQTNGIVLGRNPQLVKDLKKLGVTGIGISIDGFEKTHDDFRGMRGSYDLAVKAAQTAVDEGLTVTVSTVAHAKNVGEIPEFFEKVKQEIKPRVYRVMAIDPLGRADLNQEYLLDNKQTRQVLSFLFNEYVRSSPTYANPETTMVELGCGGWLGRDLEGMTRPFIFHCIAGINNLGILYDGKLAACSNIPRVFGFEGDLRRGDKIKDIWENRYERYRNFNWRKTEDCADCGEWEYCHGGPMHKMRQDGTRTDCLFQMLCSGTC